MLHTGGIPCVCKSLAPLCSALLLPGGGDLEPWRYGQKNTASQGLEPERDCAEFELIERYLSLRRPILGICRGMQVLNVFFGGTLLQDLPGHSQIQGQDRFHFIQTFPSPFAQLYPSLSIVNSAHHQAVDRPGSGLQVVQIALDGTPEALTHQHHDVWGVQWHPERLGPNGLRLFHAFLSCCI
ncbi:MAG: gamma-glutamyl-gamma-aminobutyrate hydrolase family protein [Dysosmobacter sp.]